MVSTNKKAPADVGASRAGANQNNQVQDKPIHLVCQMEVARWLRFVFMEAVSATAV